MSIATIFLSIGIFIVIGVFIGLIVYYYQEKSKYTKTGKTIINHLSHLNNAKKTGKVFKTEDVGKNKELLRIHYLSNVSDEDGEKKVIKQVAICKKNKILEDRDVMYILPRTKEEVPEFIPEYEKICRYIDISNDNDIQIEAENDRYRKFKTRYVKGYGGELTRFEIDERLELLRQIVESKDTSSSKKDAKKKT